MLIKVLGEILFGDVEDEACVNCDKAAFKNFMLILFSCFLCLFISLTLDQVIAFWIGGGN